MRAAPCRIWRAKDDRIPPRTREIGGAAVHRKLRHARAAVAEKAADLLLGIVVAQHRGTGGAAQERSTRVALVGLRGAGKSTLGQMLAQDLGYPFVELSREIEKFAGCSVAEIQALYGANAYRRYERRALEESIQIYPEAVIATPGGLVSDPASFTLLLAHCTTLWLQADPADHLRRVTAQGDLRPMAAS